LGDAIIAQEKLFAQKFFTCYDGRPINQLEYLMDKLNFSVKARDYDRVFIEEHNGDQVWLSLAVRNGSMFTVMTKEQAKELIDALQEVIA
tara:strand:+ start:1026 stop:1295 length:270 start_codon:yes stop_codon:yes gene_type:complete